MPYQPIEDYGLIGNLRTAALVGMDGSIDWLCLPDFDSPSVFAALLDDRKGGRFRIAPPGEGFRLKQHYWPNTNILITRFLHPDGIGEIEDYMPADGTGGAPMDKIVRRVRAIHGCMPFHLECRPAFDYARAPHSATLNSESTRFDGPGLSLELAASVPLRCDGEGVIADFILDEGQSATLFCADSIQATPRVTARVLQKLKRVFAIPLRTGSVGCPTVLTRAAGARWCSALRLPSS